MTGSISKKGDIQSKLKDIEVQLDAREQEIAKIRQKILNRIKQQTEQACKFVTFGMTTNDVTSMLGEPAGMTTIWQPFGGYHYKMWTYGSVKIHFDRSDIVDKVDCN